MSGYFNSDMCRRHEACEMAGCRALERKLFVLFVVGIYCIRAGVVHGEEANQCDRMVFLQVFCKVNEDDREARKVVKRHNIQCGEDNDDM